jgi:hypothetical protein
MPDALLQARPKQWGRGRPFLKGQSGNPAGRPRGSKNRKTLAARELLEGESGALTRKAIDMAMSGDASTMRACLDRIIAPRRDPEVRFDLPPIRDAGDIAGAMAAIMRALARGDMTPAEAGEIGRLVETFMRAIECTDFERRLRRIEANPSPPVSW